MSALLGRVQQCGKLIVLALAAVPLRILQPVVVGPGPVCGVCLCSRECATADRDRRSAGGSGVCSAVRGAFARRASVGEREPEVSRVEK